MSPTTCTTVNTTLTEKKTGKRNSPMLTVHVGAGGDLGLQADNTSIMIHIYHKFFWMWLWYWKHGSSHKPSSMPPLLSAMPTVTYQTARHHCSFFAQYQIIQLGGRGVCANNLSRVVTLKVGQPDVEPTTSQSQIQCHDPYTVHSMQHHATLQS